MKLYYVRKLQTYLIIQKWDQISMMKLRDRGQTEIMKLYLMKLKPTITINKV